jgi:hypothetical protein
MNRIVSLACLCVLAVVGLAAAPSAAHAAPKPKVAILGLELKDDGTGIDERSANIARMLTDALRKRANVQNGPYNLSPGSDKELVDAMLLGGCGSSAETDCMVRIGGDMAADFLIFGRLEKQGKGFQVSLTLLDIGKKTIVRRLSDIIPAGETGQVDLDRWGKSLYSRLAGVSNKGSITVTANVESGQVFIDGVPKANLVKGKAQISGLDEGKVKVRVESDGAVTEQVVTVSGGDTAEVRANLDKGGSSSTTDGTTDTTTGEGTTGTANLNLSTEGSVSKRPGAGWRKVFIGSAIVAAAAGGTALALWISYRGTNENGPGGSFSQCVLGSDAPEDPTGDWDSKCTRMKVVTALDIIGIGAVVLGGVAFYKGYISAPDAESPSQGASRRRKAKRSPVTFTPVITEQGAGATMRIDW